mmetsp:Transcript_2012/g.1918  ORF Transcript_2012/g.1918 Transcript_2012/m.1918 type:complete len:85 (+) Transcript_2012:103-357(+)
MLLAKNNKLAMLDEIIANYKNEIDPNHQDIYGKTLLHYAVIKNNPMLVDRILNSFDNLDLDITDNLKGGGDESKTDSSNPGTGN